MKILFVDESKKQEKGVNDAFILTGVMIDANKVVEVENKLDEIKERYGINKIEDIRKVKTKEAREGFTTEIREVLYENNCKIISAIEGQFALDSCKKIEEAYPYCFKFILERFFINLNIEKEYGLIIHDFFGKPYGDSFIAKAYNMIKNEKFEPPWIKKKTPYKDRVYPQIFFGKDDYSNLLQVADIIAATLNFAYMGLKKEIEESGEELHTIKGKICELKEKNEYLKIYWDLFICDSNGNPSGYGIKIWV